MTIPHDDLHPIERDHLAYLHEFAARLGDRGGQVSNREIFEMLGISDEEELIALARVTHTALLSHQRGRDTGIGRTTADAYLAISLLLFGIRLGQKGLVTTPKGDRA